MFKKAIALQSVGIRSSLIVQVPVLDVHIDHIEGDFFFVSERDTFIKVMDYAEEVKKIDIKSDRTIKRCAIWVNKCKRQDLDETFKTTGTEYLYKNHRICSDHFRLSDFNNPNLKSQGVLKKKEKWEGGITDVSDLDVSVDDKNVHHTNEETVLQENARAYVADISVQRYFRTRFGAEPLSGPAIRKQYLILSQENAFVGGNEPDAHQFVVSGQAKDDEFLRTKGSETRRMQANITCYLHLCKKVGGGSIMDTSIVTGMRNRIILPHLPKFMPLQSGHRSVTEISREYFSPMKTRASAHSIMRVKAPYITQLCRGTNTLTFKHFKIQFFNTGQRKSNV
ncbi:hypothetical protein ANN_23807 [Periplaneta americana]|uniref:THAP-type domain-containing protein n=1 Tax=Periplaneta americana TaxID=6978 RepID=A0ABQ8SN16_PERAM|nr:hypothetical protein ANN_23807 [Periplaneta americana]